MPDIIKTFPRDYDCGGGEAQKSYLRRVESGFFSKYYGGDLVLDIGYRGAANPGEKTIVPGAVGIDLDYPNYDGVTLPFEDETVDCVSSSHCLEHMLMDQRAITDWYRVLKFGGYICCFVPHQHLYEKRRFPPSDFNSDHIRFFTPASLLSRFEETLGVNSFRVRHLADNDFGFDYALGPGCHSAGCYEIELVLEKIRTPVWNLA